MQKLVPRLVEERRLAMFCDRCERNIPLEYKHGKHVMTKGGGSLTLRGQDVWTPLIPTEWVESITHTEDYHRANVDICPSCIAELQEWFLKGRE